MISIRQLRYFTTIVDRGSFTKAAELLGIAQPSLSFQIRGLEDTLGVQVLVRNSRGVKLTDAGQILYDQGRAIVDRIDELERTISALSAKPEGTVMLGIPPSLADRLLVPIIREVGIQYPSIELNVVEDMSQNLLDLLDAGKIDLALVFNVDQGAGLVVRHLGVDNVYLLSRSLDAKPERTPIALRDLADVPLILPQRPHRVRQLIDEAAAAGGFEIKVVAEMSSIGSVMRMVQAGIGSTLAAGSLTQRQLPDGELVARPIDPPLTYNISLIHRSSTQLSRGQMSVAQVCARKVDEFFEHPAELRGEPAS